jgi:ABC transporter DrrB family efflux protein
MIESLRWELSDSLVLARRNLAHVRQVPEKLLDVTLQPLMFVLLFAYVFGGVISVPGGSYREYLIGGILVQTLTFGIVGPAIAIATDMTEGIIDRFRSLPMSRSAFLLGHLIASLAATCLSVVILAGSGFVVGWRIHAGAPDAILGFALLLTFAFAMLWVGALLGLIVRSPDAVMGIAFAVIFPLTFLSNAFVPVDGLPQVLEIVASWNPVSTVVAATRTLFGNPTALPADAAWPLQHPVLCSFAWCAVLIAVAAPLAVRRYRARTTG